MKKLQLLLLVVTFAFGSTAFADEETKKVKPVSTPSKANDFGVKQSEVEAMEKNLSSGERKLRNHQLERLKAFSKAKEKQAEKIAAEVGIKVNSEAHRFFDAGKEGDYKTVFAMFKDFGKRHRQYEGSKNDKSLDTPYWATMLEVDLAYECVIPMDPKNLQYFIDDTLNSIPHSSIFFGGTDPGRGLPTAFVKSHADADPFFVITQNALADISYLDYLRRMYASKIYIPSTNDSSKCFGDYMQDAQRRLDHDNEYKDEPKQIRPGESIHVQDGRLSVSGQVAVMEINGLLAKVIFDHNPDKEFYIEESFPLNWMYPYLEPHGPIMKLNRTPLKTLPDSLVNEDHDYWKKRVGGMVGDWLTDDTPLKTVTEFAEKVYARKDLSGFSGDKSFIQCSNGQKMWSKLRSSIAGVYDWHRKNASSDEEKSQMLHQEDLAYRQAIALCPYSPEAVFRYVNLLVEIGRNGDAKLIASAAATIDPTNQQVADLLQNLNRMAK